MTEVRWSKRAIGDIEAIRAFIMRDSEHYARAVVRRIVLAMDRVEEFPQSGRVVPEVGDDTLREVIWKRYRIVYRLREGVAEVLTVHDSAKSFPSL